MRLRRTAPPSAFLTLQPKRLRARPLGRRKIVNSRLDRRRPWRYTASYSARRTSRQARGKPSRGESDARETVAPFLAALRKDFPSALAFHAPAESVLFVTGTYMGLISAFWQRSLSCAACELAERSRVKRRLATGHASPEIVASRARTSGVGETVSVDDGGGTVKKTEGYG